MIGVAEVEGLNTTVLQTVQVEEAEEPEVKPANKTLLQQALSQADALEAAGELEGVNELVLREFRRAREEARTILADEKADQEEVNTAWLRLSRAIQMLGMKTDKTELRALIARAESLNLDDYKEEGRQAFQDALDYARQVNEDPAALTDVSIQAAIEKLQAAMDALEKKPADLDLSLLQMLVDSVEGTDLNKYLSEGQDELQNALEEARTVLASAENQEQVDASVARLHNAWLSLRLKADESLLAQLKDASVMLRSLSLTAYAAPMQARITAVADSIDALLEQPEVGTQEALDTLDEARTLMKELDLPELPEPDLKPADDLKTPSDQTESSQKPAETEKKTAEESQTAKSVKTAASFSWIRTSAAALGALGLFGILAHNRRRR